MGTLFSSTRSRNVLQEAWGEVSRYVIRKNRNNQIFLAKDGCLGGAADNEQAKVNQIIKSTSSDRRCLGGLVLSVVFIIPYPISPVLLWLKPLLYRCGRMITPRREGSNAISKATFILIHVEVSASGTSWCLLCMRSIGIAQFALLDLERSRGTFMKE